MLLAVSTFSCLDATSKYLAALYAVPTIVWARYVSQMLLMVLVLGPRMGMGLLRTVNLRLQVVRGAVLTASSLLYLTALSRHERVEGRTWLALAAGFGGVLLIVRPGRRAFRLGVGAATRERAHDGGVPDDDAPARGT